MVQSAHGQQIRAPPSQGCLWLIDCFTESQNRPVSKMKYKKVILISTAYILFFFWHRTVGEKFCLGSCLVGLSVIVLLCQLQMSISPRATKQMRHSPKIERKKVWPWKKKLPRWVNRLRKQKHNEQPKKLWGKQSNFIEHWRTQILFIIISFRISYTLNIYFLHHMFPF